MTVHATSQRTTRVEAAAADAQEVLGARKASRIATFDNGALYVRAGAGRQFLAWLIDFTVYLFGVGVGIVAVAVVHRSMPLSDDVLAVVMLSLFVVVPLVYGLCFGNGRALGGVLTGTQLVRIKDGSRVGLRASWVMLIRTLLMPVLVVGALADAFTGGGTSGFTSELRICIDPTATRRLHDAGIR
ncbi:RDD family protein [Micromonospora sp. NPDC093244]|uniref:RDD family protein n=1 Tax=Micromonospora sp. NPDC093244 TaxID=3155071 RepID=UPI003437C050